MSIGRLERGFTGRFLPFKRRAKFACEFVEPAASTPEVKPPPPPYCLGRRMTPNSAQPRTIVRGKHVCLSGHHQPCRHGAGCFACQSSPHPTGLRPATPERASLASTPRFANARGGGKRKSTLNASPLPCIRTKIPPPCASGFPRCLR